MLGFFSKKETESTTRPDGKKLSCVACGLYKGDLEHPKMAPTGNFKKGILNIGDFTTAWDDRKGKPFQSKQAAIIYNTYKKLGIDLEEDCLNVNSVMCHPYKHDTGKPRNPTSHEIQCCRLNMLRIIKQHKPKLIVVFGTVALESIIGHRWKKGLDSMNRWRGWVIPDQEYNSWVAPVFSPTYVSGQDNKAVQLIWEQDLIKALKHLDKPFRKFVEPEITVLKDLSELSKIKNLTKCAFDYETTGLKPHKKKHKIISASIADSANHVYVFMLLNKKNKQLSRSKLKPFINFLINPYIPKIAQHMKFEENWSYFKFRIRVKGWFHDTMIWTHILDNRSSITGLKFQAYVCFGIDAYDEDVANYITAKDANSFNKMIEFVSTSRGRKSCLKYNAWDSILEYRLAEIQEEYYIENTLPF
jgi:uracil-DNA glycosylase family 4